MAGAGKPRGTRIRPPRRASSNGTSSIRRLQADSEQPGCRPPASAGHHQQPARQHQTSIGFECNRAVGFALYLRRRLMRDQITHTPHDIHLARSHRCTLANHLEQFAAMEVRPSPAPFRRREIRDRDEYSSGFSCRVRTRIHQGSSHCRNHRRSPPGPRSGVPWPPGPITHFSSVLRTIERVPFLRLFINDPRARRREEIVFRGSHHPRLRSEQLDPVRLVQP